MTQLGLCCSHRTVIYESKISPVNRQKISRKNNHTTYSSIYSLYKILIAYTKQQQENPIRQCGI